ncbi:hypothetical protein TomMM35A_30990 [Sphingobium sp. TomMM35A]
MNAPFVIRPVAEPRIVDGVYTEDQHARMMDVIRREGPWKLVLAQHFKSVEELIATGSGSMPEGVTPTLDMFVSPHFRGYFAQHGVCQFEELEDIFYNSGNMARVRSYWNAKYAAPESMNFIIQGAAHMSDPAHLDATEFRGITHRNTPIWLMNTMTKSGLFQKWLVKKAQIVSWFYRGTIGGGFTYWPDGPQAAPKRIAAPMWNRGVVVQNEMMFHRGEACGPLHRRKPEGLAFESVISADPEVADGWRIKTGDRVIDRISADEVRLMVHWGANVYADMDEMKMILEHKDDLTHEQVLDMFCADLRKRGVSFGMPSDFLHDRDFIRVLTATYDMGRPSIYPREAPGPHEEQIAA